MQSIEMAKIITKKNTGAHASMKPCGSKPSRPLPWPSWKISRPAPKAAAVASRFVRTASAAISGAWTTTSSSRNPSASTAPITSGVLSRSALASSWFSAAWPPTTAPGEVAAEAVDRRPVVALDGSERGMAWISARPSAPGSGRSTRAMPGRAGRRRRGRGVALRRDDPQRSGRASAERLLQLRVADAGAVALRDDLDRRHAGLHPSTGTRARRARPPQAGPTGAPAATAALPSAPIAASGPPSSARDRVPARRSWVRASRARRATG